MNKIFRLKFNRQLQQLVVVSELAMQASKLQTGSSTSEEQTQISSSILSTQHTPTTLKYQGRNKLCTLLGIGITSLGVIASPSFAHTGAQVVAGQAQIVTQGLTTSITTSDNTIIDWQSFNVGKNELVQFIQANAQSSVLNRVLGTQVSQILGQLRSNGRVFLVNPNGIIFGKHAQVDVGSLVASTLNISNDNFLAGKYVFDQAKDHALAQVLNQGLLSINDDGKLMLIGGSVVNQGVLQAKHGDVYLLAGKQITISDFTNPKISYHLTAGNQALNLSEIFAHGKVTMIASQVNNSGRIQARSSHGVVELFGDEPVARHTQGQFKQLTTSMASSKVKPVTTVAKVITATTTASKPLQLSMPTQPAYSVRNSGAITAHAIHVQASDIALANGTNITALGATSARGLVGGTITIGNRSDFAMPQSLRIATGASLTATTATELASSTRATTTHDTMSQVPSIVMYAQQAHYAGAYHTSSQGIIETSGNQVVLDPNVQINTQGGHWLLDPNDIFVTNSSIATTTATSSSNGEASVTYPAEGEAPVTTSLTDSFVKQQLQNNDVTLYTKDGDITFNQVFIDSHSGHSLTLATKAGQINLNDTSLCFTLNNQKYPVYYNTQTNKYSNYLPAVIADKAQFKVFASKGINFNHSTLQVAKLYANTPGNLTLSNSLVKGEYHFNATLASLAPATLQDFPVAQEPGHDFTATASTEELASRPRQVVLQDVILNNGNRTATFTSDTTTTIDNLRIVGSANYRNLGAEQYTLSPELITQTITPDLPQLTHDYQDITAASDTATNTVVVDTNHIATSDTGFAYFNLTNVKQSHGITAVGTTLVLNAQAALASGTNSQPQAAYSFINQASLITQNSGYLLLNAQALAARDQGIAFTTQSITDSNTLQSYGLKALTDLESQALTARDHLTHIYFNGNSIYLNAVTSNQATHIADFSKSQFTLSHMMGKLQYASVITDATKSSTIPSSLVLGELTATNGSSFAVLNTNRHLQQVTSRQSSTTTSDSPADLTLVGAISLQDGSQVSLSSRHELKLQGNSQAYFASTIQAQNPTLQDPTSTLYVAPSSPNINDQDQVAAIDNGDHLIPVDSQGVSHSDTPLVLKPSAEDLPSNVLPPFLAVELPEPEPTPQLPLPPTKPNVANEVLVEQPTTTTEVPPTGVVTSAFHIDQTSSLHLLAPNISIANYTLDNHHQLNLGSELEQQSVNISLTDIDASYLGMLTLGLVHHVHDVAGATHAHQASKVYATFADVVAQNGHLNLGYTDQASLSMHNSSFNQVTTTIDYQPHTISSHNVPSLLEAIAPAVTGNLSLNFTASSLDHSDFHAHGANVSITGATPVTVNPTGERVPAVSDLTLNHSSLTFQTSSSVADTVSYATQGQVTLGNLTISAMDVNAYNQVQTPTAVATDGTLETSNPDLAVALPTSNISINAQQVEFDQGSQQDLSFNRLQVLAERVAFNGNTQLHSINLEHQADNTALVSPEQAFPGSYAFQSLSTGAYFGASEITLQQQLAAEHTVLDLHATHSLQQAVGSSIQANTLYLGDYRAANPVATYAPVTGASTAILGNTLNNFSVYTNQLAGKITASNVTIRNNVTLQQASMSTTQDLSVAGNLVATTQSQVQVAHNFMAEQAVELTNKASLTVGHNFQAQDLHLDDAQAQIMQMAKAMGTIDLVNDALLTVTDTLRADSLFNNNSSVSANDITITDRFQNSHDASVVAHNEIQAGMLEVVNGSVLKTTDLTAKDVFVNHSQVVATGDSAILNDLTVINSTYYGTKGQLLVGNHTSLETGADLQVGTVTSKSLLVANQSQLHTTALQTAGNVTVVTSNIQAHTIDMINATANILFQDSKVVADRHLNVTAKVFDVDQSTVAAPTAVWQAENLNILDANAQVVIKDLKAKVGEFDLDNVHSIKTEQLHLVCERSPKVSCDPNKQITALDDSPELPANFDQLIVSLLDFGGGVFSSDAESASSSDDDQDEDSKDKKKSTDGKTASKTPAVGANSDNTQSNDPATASGKQDPAVAQVANKSRKEIFRTINKINELVKKTVTNETGLTSPISPVATEGGIDYYLPPTAATIAKFRAQGVARQALPYGASDSAFTSLRQVNIQQVFSKLDASQRDVTSKAADLRQATQVSALTHQPINVVKSDKLEAMLPSATPRAPATASGKAPNVQVIVEASSAIDLFRAQQSRKRSDTLIRQFGTTKLKCRRSDELGISALCYAADSQKPSDITKTPTVTAQDLQVAPATAPNPVVSQHTKDVSVTTK